MNIKETKCTLGALLAAGKIKAAPGTEQEMIKRIEGIEIPIEEYFYYKEFLGYVGITDEFRKVVKLFDTPEGQTPAGFRKEFVYSTDGMLQVNLVRDIAFGENGIRRPTNVLFSANTANPFEIATMKDFIANVTTNPSLIYSQFLNNPKANIGGQFKDSYEVLKELSELVGPGVDISVEITDPFAEEEKILEEIAKNEEVLTKYRLVVKVPHTGPLNKENINDYINGKYPALEEGRSVDYFRGHNLAYRLQEKGYRVNFTLMSDPHQTALALLAKPYFINAFVEKRTDQTRGLVDLLDKYNKSRDKQYYEQVLKYMKRVNLLGSEDQDADKAMEKARLLVNYRHAYDHEGSDGLDSVRHSLRVLRLANLPDTRIIICNTKTDRMYYDIDKMLAEDEFADMKQKVVLTCEPEYFGRYTSSSTIYAYQRDFLTSVKQ